MKSFKGYCSDIFADQAINFITRNAGAPFFCYLSFNAPHTPLQVPEEYYRRYKNIDPAAGFKYVDHSGLTMTEKDKEDARRVYAMVNNIDDNIGKLLKKLEALGIADNTIVIFMSDNGPQQSRYLAGLRGLKGKVYEGGVRVPFYMRYPLLGKNKDINNLAAHIDVLPTLANLCHVRLPDNRIIDGKNLVPAVTAEAAEWNNRSLFFYWTRRYPEPYQNISLRKGNYKLVGNTDADADIKGFELYDLSRDPGERHNILPGNRAVANDLKAELDKIFKDLAGSENFIRQPAIVVGSDSENPILLNRNDAGGQRAIWAQEEIYGKWRVHVHQGYYNIKFKFIRPVAGKGNMYLEANESLVKQVTQKEENTDLIEMKNVYFPEMECDLIPYYTTGSKNIFPFWVEMEKIN